MRRFMRVVHKQGDEKQGKTLILQVILTTAWLDVPRTAMFSVLSLLVRAFRKPLDAAELSPAAALLESADSRAGHDPHHAHELREAAAAWLRVVR